jgi:hypothetical protein
MMDFHQKKVLSQIRRTTPIFRAKKGQKGGLYAEFGLGLFFGENPSYKDVKNAYIAFF